jgi:hypothetical protein
MLRPNPDYGTATFRRGLRLAVDVRVVRIDLEDSNHAFRLVLRHDGSRIASIEPEFVRHPFTTCPEAGRILGQLVGRALDGMLDVRRLLDARDTCTHLVDMTAIALAHVHEPGLTRLYEVAVEDERDGNTRARVNCDGEPVHDWIVVGHALSHPANFAGQPLMHGFPAWARSAFSGMPLEAAFALQRGYFVAQARRYDTSPEQEHPAIGDGLPDGVCYSYSTPAVVRAQRIEGSKRDFTNASEAVLRFERR